MRIFAFLIILFGTLLVIFAGLNISENDIADFTSPITIGIFGVILFFYGLKVYNNNLPRNENTPLDRD